MRFLRRFVVVLIAASALYAGYEWLTWPDAGALAVSYPKTTAFIEAWRAGQRDAGKDPSVQWTPVPYARISSHLKRAVLVAEDIDFFSHKGFDVEELRRAVKDAWDDKEFPRGASTVTQQLAKNLWLSPSRNPLRKLKEALLTKQLEAKLGKRRILELYLDVVEFGPGIFGAEAASRRWFGKSAAALDEREAALLAASLTRPRSWHPGVTSSAYLRRAALIEARMAKASWLASVI